MTKGKKNEPRKIDQWSSDDLAFPDNRTKSFAFDSPYGLERGLEGTELESILREFEDEAKKILEENGLDSEELIEAWRICFDVKDFSSLCLQLEYDFPSLLSPLSTSMQLQNAAHVFFCADRVRSDISKNDAKQTAIDMLKLCFTAVAANLHEIIKRGIRAKMGPTKPRPSRKKAWIDSVLEYARANAQRKNFPGVMTYLRRHEGKAKALKIDNGKVYLSPPSYWKGDYKLNYVVRNKKPQHIGTWALKKHFEALKKLGS